MFRIEIDHEFVYLFQGLTLLAKVTISEWSFAISRPKRRQ
jgi:hypothetical protein